LQTHELERLAQQRLQEEPELNIYDFEELAPLEETAETNPEYYRQRMLWIITTSTEKAPRMR
jgi:hypothetical protein